MKRLALLVCIVGSVVALGCSKTGGSQATTTPAIPGTPAPPVVDALSGTCECPQPHVVTAKRDPNIGFLRTNPNRSIAAQDPNPDDLRAMFSNRDTRYGDSWTLALRSLAHDIDPDGRLGIAHGPAPPPFVDAAVVEGILSQSWTRPAGTVERGMRGAGSQSPFRFVTRALDVMGVLVATIARSNKYGEPSFGVRENALAIAQFSTDALAIPSGTDAKSRLLSGFGTESRIAWYNDVYSATLKGPLPGLDPIAVTALPIDRFDLANAALDVLAWREAKNGALHVVDAAKWEPGAVVNIPQLGVQRVANGSNLGPTGPPSNSRELGTALAQLASMRSAFGSAFSQGSPQDAIGCKAYNLILRVGKGGVINVGLTRVLAYTLPDPLTADPQPPSELRSASLSALAAVGFKDDAEAQSVAKSLFQLGYPDEAKQDWRGHPIDWSARNSAVVDAMRTLSARGGPNDHAADAFYEQSLSDFKNLEKAQQQLQLAPAGRAYLARWNVMNAVHTGARAAGLPPVCPGGQTHCDIEKVVDAPEPLFETASQVHVRPADAQNEDDAENLYWTEPITVEVKVPIKGANGQQHPSVTVQNLKTGKSAVVSTTFDYAEPGLAVFHSRRVYFNASKLFGPTESPEEKDGSLIELGKGVLKSYFGGPPNYIGIEAHNGETVRFTFGEAEPVEIDFYDTPYQAAIANYKRSFETMSLYYSALIGAPSTKEHAVDARADQQEAARKVRLLVSAGRIIDSRIDAIHGYRFTDLSRLKVAQLYEKLVENQQVVYTGMQYEGQAPPAHFTGDTPLERAFGIVCGSVPEYAGLLDALSQAHAELLDKTTQLGVVYTLGTYHAVVAASGAENYVILWFGVDSQGKEYDASGRINAGLSIVKDLVVSKLQGDLFEKVHSKLTGGPEGPWRVRSEAARDAELTVLEPGIVGAPTEKGLAGIARADGDPVARMAGTPVAPPRGATGTYGWKGEVEVRVAPLDGIPTPQQRFANGCGIATAESILRALIPKKLLSKQFYQHWIDQSALAAFAYRKGWFTPGVKAKVHDINTVWSDSGAKGGGMWEPEVARLVENFGVKARGFQSNDLSLLRAYKEKGWEVAVVIKVDGGTHWARIQGFEKMKSGNLGVAVGDSGYGKSVTVNANDFCDQLFRSVKSLPGGAIARNYHAVVARF